VGPRRRPSDFAGHRGAGETDCEWVAYGGESRRELEFRRSAGVPWAEEVTAYQSLAARDDLPYSSKRRPSLRGDACPGRAESRNAAALLTPACVLLFAPVSSPGAQHHHGEHFSAVDAGARAIHDQLPAAFEQVEQARLALGPLELTSSPRPATASADALRPARHGRDAAGFMDPL